MPLIGDARRRRKVERMRLSSERERLAAECRAVKALLAGALGERDPLTRAARVGLLRRRLEAVAADYATVAARERSARRDLGEI